MKKFISLILPNLFTIAIGIIILFKIEISQPRAILMTISLFMVVFLTTLSIKEDLEQANNT